MEAKSTTAEVWRERIAAQQASELSIRGWCQSHNIAEHAFYWWRRRLGISPTPAATCQPALAKPVAFAEVVVHPQPVADVMTLRLRSGHELRLPASMAVEQVARLVRAIEGLP